MKFEGRFPDCRLRRGRSSVWLRDLLAENTLSVADLVLPVFVTSGNGVKEPISSMPGVLRHSVDTLVTLAQQAQNIGIPAIALFPVVDAHLKSDYAEEALKPDNLICRAIAAVKETVPGIGIICDVALDPYTSHGHDGLMEKDIIANDKTVEVLCRQALVLAEAGADIVAPSDMMDGRVGCIRRALEESGFQDVKILSYSAKYASCFYTPFRHAVGSAANLKHADKKTYQMNPANSNEALREVALDISEGADAVMVKPGLPYLDIISRIKAEFNIPVFAYHVSGEYSMLKLAADNGLLDWKQGVMECLLAFKRAGCSGIFTYAALDAASILRDSTI